jgi:hypothetical protein
MLFVLVGAGWWAWPGPNAAYVGSWKSADGAGEQFQLKSDGTMATPLGNFYWWIRGDQMFELRTGATSPVWQFRDVFMAKFFSKTTSTSALIRFVVTEKADGTMTILAPDQKHYLYRRVTE